MPGDDHELENRTLEMPARVKELLGESVDVAGEHAVALCVVPRVRSDGLTVPVMAMESRLRTALTVKDNYRLATITLAGVLLSYDRFARDVAHHARREFRELNGAIWGRFAELDIMLGGGEEPPEPERKVWTP
ncbi:MAG TPA: hypothetical protein VKA74_09840 [Myxococcota bacterium]|nr:hypothetical protein [Myxococcota bacterium]